jgi:hypothetical protein
MSEDEAENGFPISCSICNKELDQAGALVFGPPIRFTGMFTNTFVTPKYHTCVSCWNEKVKPLFVYSE